MRVIDMVGIAGGAVAGTLTCTWSAGSAIPAIGRALIVFFSMKIAGDALKALLKRDETYYLEDLLIDIAAYASLAVISTAATWLARRYLGGGVEPVYPAGVAHAVLTMMPGRDQQKQAARG